VHIRSGHLYRWKVRCLRLRGTTVNDNGWFESVTNDIEDTMCTHKLTNCGLRVRGRRVAQRDGVVVKSDVSPCFNSTAMIVRSRDLYEVTLGIFGVAEEAASFATRGELGEIV
jgi:hypothetical protein